MTKNNTPKYIELKKKIETIIESALIGKEDRTSDGLAWEIIMELTKTIESERERVIGEIEKYVEEERCDGHMPFYSRDFESMFDQINKLKKK